MPWAIAMHRASSDVQLDRRVDLAALERAAEIEAEHFGHLLHVPAAEVSSTDGLRMASAQISANRPAVPFSCMCLIWAIAPATTPSTTSGLLRMRAEHFRILAPVGLADRLDDRFLRSEVAIERARAHAGFGADLLHGGALEAEAPKQVWPPRGCAGSAGRVAPDATGLVASSASSGPASSVSVSSMVGSRARANVHSPFMRMIILRQYARGRLFLTIQRLLDCRFCLPNADRGSRPAASQEARQRSSAREQPNCGCRASSFSVQRTI